MDDPFAKAFLREIDGQCNYALLAIGAMRTFSAEWQETQDKETGARFWFSAQGMLVAAANVSKIMYPPKSSKPRAIARGSSLRQLLGDAVSAPFGGDTFRFVRNDYEHIDDRLDEWGARGPFVDYNFARVGMLANDFGAVNTFRNFDPDSETLTFWHNDFPIQPVEVAIKALQARIAVLMPTR